jgi:dephospho-CoA kinase
MVDEKGSAARLARTRLIGLTGGLASGKSTVGRMLRELGAEVLDADVIAREVVAPGQPALADIVREFGPEVLLSDGTLDRKALAAKVFSDPAARRTLNAITHPRVGAETARRMQEAQARGLAQLVYEVPLLVENQLHHGMDGVIVVTVPEAEQVRRAVERDGMTEAEARARLAAQARPEQRLAVADYVIDNTGSPDDTRRQVEAAWRDILAGGPKRPAPPKT